MQAVLDNLQEPITRHLLQNFVALDADATAEETIDILRNNHDIPDINYLYVIDRERRLVGVLPTRRLLTSSPTARVRDFMQADPVSIPNTVTTLQACELFMEHKYLAYPVTDDEHRLVGAIDVTLFNRDVVDVAKRTEITNVFETLGVHLSTLTQASPLAAFGYRFPWLLATITSGTLCALISSRFGATLEQSIVIAFFLTLVLGLAESMSVQAMTVAIQTLHSQPPSWRTFFTNVVREGSIGFMLALASGLLVTGIVLVWYETLRPALVIGSSIALCMTIGNLTGLIIPNLLHALKLNFRIAAGPLTLAITDLSTLSCYFTVAWLSFR